MKENIFKTAIGVIGGALVWLYGGAGPVLIILAVMMAIDYLTGLIKAGVTKTLSSSIGFRGLAKKGGILLAVAVGCLVDKLAGPAMLTDKMVELTLFGPAVCLFYTANEGISILENLSAIGVPMHPALLKALQKLKAQVEEHEPIVRDLDDDLVQKPPNVTE